VRAAEHGADAIVVSSHGGRNLDSAVSPIHALPRIVDAVGHRLDVLADSGVRRGSDVLKLLALGAKAVLVGRSPLFGTAWAGEEGARHVIDLLRGEMDTGLAFLGCPSLSALGRDFVNIRNEPRG
jgi:(S)-mandelate dehydrogenase